MNALATPIPARSGPRPEARPADAASLPYLEVDHPDPHRERALRIRAAHPEVQDLVGRNPWTAAIASALVAAQLGVAGTLAALEAPWWLAVAIAWCGGAFVCHALFVIIHETCHRLVFRGRPANRGLALLANLPMLAPFAIGLSHYHLVHHRTQGQRGRDPDLPWDWEVRWFDGSRVGRLVWHLLFPLIQATRSAHREDRDTLDGRDPWLVANAAVQLAVTVAIGLAWGWTAILYLAVSLYFMFSLHPLAGRFVQEHFVFEGIQETTSYDGPLSILALHFGHHVEHHDFPAVPWNRLPRIRRLAPEAYDTLASHRSWTRLWLRLLLDPDLRLANRVVRPATAPAGGVGLRPRIVAFPGPEAPHVCSSPEERWTRPGERAVPSRSGSGPSPGSGWGSRPSSERGIPVSTSPPSVGTGPTWSPSWRWGSTSSAASTPTLVAGPTRAGRRPTTSSTSTSRSGRISTTAGSGRPRPSRTGSARPGSAATRASGTSAPGTAATASWRRPC